MAVGSASAVFAGFTEADMVSLDLHVEPVIVGDCAVLQVAGDVDISTAPELRDALNRTHAAHMVVDMRGVVFLDSTGLGVLVGAHKRLQHRGGSLKIVTRRADRARRLFELTGLSRAFDLYMSVLDAIASDPNWQTAISGDPADWCLHQQLR
jgi:anti-sigma B factor antagonist